jgi:hypothetical protein
MSTATRPRRPADYGAYTDGASALAVDYAYESDVDRLEETEGRIPSRERERRQPWVTPADEPVAAPLPIALPRAPFLILIVALVVAGVLGVLVLNTKINENSFRLNDLRNNQAALDLREQQLQRDLADRESPGNLRAAATRLGLVPAGTPAFINLPDGRVVGVPQPAAGR